MKAMELNAQPYMKLVLVLSILMVVVVLTGMTESQISANLLQTLPPDMNSLQGHAIFQSLF